MAAFKVNSGEFVYGAATDESNVCVCYWFSVEKKRGLHIFFSKHVFVTIEFVKVIATQKLKMKIAFDLSFR